MDPTQITIYFNCSDYNNQSDSTCEKWRIIGVFKNMTKEDGTNEDLVKIIRNDFIDNIAWDDRSSTSSSSLSNSSKKTKIKMLNNKNEDLTVTI